MGISRPKDAIASRPPAPFSSGSAVVDVETGWWLLVLEQPVSTATDASSGIAQDCCSRVMEDRQVLSLGAGAGQGLLTLLGLGRLDRKCRPPLLSVSNEVDQ